MARAKNKISRLLDADWVQVDIPRPWRPKYTGEELVGFYGGRTIRHGMYGEYTVILIHIPKLGAVTLSGTDIVQRVDAAMLEEGEPVRIVWCGYKELGDEKRKKIYDLWVTRKS